MSASNPPISQRPSPGDAAHAGGPASGGGAGAGAPQGPVPGGDAVVGDPRIEALKERAKQLAPWFGYSAFFLFALFFFAYLTFPYDRLRDRIIADFEKSQRVPPGGARQTLSIGKLEPSWLTGVVLKEVTLTSTPADPSKPSSILRAEEVKVRVSVGSLFSKNKDLTLSAKALGGTIEGTVTHTKTVNPTPPKPTDKDKGDKYDRIIKLELDGIALNDVAPLRDAIGANVTGQLKGSIDMTLGESRVDKANGTVAFEIEGFGVPGELYPEAVEQCKQPGQPQPCEPKRVLLKMSPPKGGTPGFGGSEGMTLPLPPIAIGAMPIQITVKNGVARIDKMSASGKDIEVNLDGQVTLREVTSESDVNVGLRFKFNESYRKKTPAAEGMLMGLDLDPKLKASKRPDGFYGLRVLGLLGGSLQIVPNPGGGPAGVPGAPVMPLSPHQPGMPGP
jgi:type II secretion system protein N